MALSQRERYIAIAVGAAFGVFALDRLVLSPYLQERERLASDKATAVKKQTDDRHVLKQQRTARQKWADLHAGGVQADPSEMDRQMQHWLTLWAPESEAPGGGGGPRLMASPLRVTGERL